MNVEIRKTAVGTEYWDTEEKRVRFVPVDEKPDFEVTENPKTMLEKGKGIRIGKEIEEGMGHDVSDSVDDEATNLDSMNATQLLAYARDNVIDVPGNMKKADTIRKHIVDLMADEGE